MKLTKNELKKQKEQLKQFSRYLPTLILKKQQLLMVIKEIERTIVTLENQLNTLQENLQNWVDVFAEKGIDLSQLISVDEIVRKSSNIAGVNVPVFERIEIMRNSYDALYYPLYTQEALDILEKIAELSAKIDIYEQQKDALAKELVTTSQRVNLFEKIKIPETKNAIKRINIFLGDQMTASVVRGKIAKQKMIVKDS